jgi:hypothetical protein
MSPSLDSRENRELAAEVKFRVPLPVGEEIREWARERLSPDPNATEGKKDEYQITSLYFDTAEFDVFRRHGSFGRSKYRIRRYGQSEKVYLERKLKTRGLVTKRRSLVPVGEVPRLAGPKAEPGWLGFWYHQRLLLRRMRPICRIGYHRTARETMSEYGPTRLTFDYDLRALPVDRLAYEDSQPGTLISDGQVIIELKYRAVIPALFKEMVEKFELNPRRVSKYRLAVIALGLVDEAVSEAAQVTPQQLPTLEYA